MANRSKAAAYHGVENVKFALKTSSGYAAEDAMLKVLYAKSLNPSTLLEAAEQYADDRLLFRVPNDKGYEVEFGTTAPDPELDKAAGFAMEGASGLLSVEQVQYVRGAMYYEFKERDENGAVSMVKCWMYNVELGKGSGTHSTDESSVAFGSYTYPARVYGDPLMGPDGTKEYVDDHGMGRKVFMYTARPGDDGYATFGDTVPVPKMAAPASGG